MYLASKHLRWGLALAFSLVVHVLFALVLWSAATQERPPIEQESPKVMFVSLLTPEVDIPASQPLPSIMKEENSTAGESKAKSTTPPAAHKSPTPAMAETPERLAAAEKPPAVEQPVLSSPQAVQASPEAGAVKEAGSLSMAAAGPVGANTGASALGGAAQGGSREPLANPTTRDAFGLYKRQFHRELGRARMYPEQARKENLSGSVVVEIRLTFGLAKAVVVSSSGSSVLDDIALQMAARAIDRTPIPLELKELRLDFKAPIRFELLD